MFLKVLIKDCIDQEYNLMYVIM
uniref:Uncharacterized protein n=1 Tax=Anguilla anguilla TaxID=7936 RepID=A0A0E9W2I8_ANGAN